MKSPIKVAVTGAAGQIDMRCFFASLPAKCWPRSAGGMHLIEIPAALNASKACHGIARLPFPTFASVVPTADLDEGFRRQSIGVCLSAVSRARRAWSEKDLSASTARFLSPGSGD